jgi:hypothetical protein
MISILRSPLGSHVAKREVEEADDQGEEGGD